MTWKVFYSWQSDLPNGTNRTFIEKALQSAVQEIWADTSVEVEPRMDCDTIGVPGTPDIVNTIFAKIASSQVFVCDVSIINQTDVAETTSSGTDDGASEVGGKLIIRPTPNPNVLIELGYAVRALGWDRIIMVQNTAFGVPDLLPFDLRPRRVIKYRAPKVPEDRSSQRKQLTGALSRALRDIITTVPIKLQEEKAIETFRECLKESMDQPNVVNITSAQIAVPPLLLRYHNCVRYSLWLIGMNLSQSTEDSSI